MTRQWRKFAFIRMVIVRILPMLLLLATNVNVSAGGMPETGFAPLGSVTYVSDDTMHGLKNDDGSARIKLTFSNHEAIVRLLDNVTCASLLEMLPVTLVFNDYAGAEKIAYLPRTLITDGSDNGYDPEIGDLTCYGPWGNLAVFYADQRYAAGLIAMGKFESGFDAFTQMGSDFEVIISLVE